MDEVQIRGVPTFRAWKHAPPTLRSRPRPVGAARRPDVHGLRGRTITFAEHYRRASTFAHRLIDDYGVRKGDRVAIAMRNFPEWLVAFWAAAVAGAVVVPLNAWWTGPELSSTASTTPARRSWSSTRSARSAFARTPTSDCSDVIVVRAQHPLTEAEVAVDDVLGAVPDRRVTRRTSPSTPRTTPPSSTRPVRPAFPKGALGTHRNICTNVMSLAVRHVVPPSRPARPRSWVAAVRPDADDARLPVRPTSRSCCRSAVPRDRMPRRDARLDRLRREARDHVQVGSERALELIERSASRPSAACPRWCGSCSSRRPSTRPTSRA